MLTSDQISDAKTKVRYSQRTENFHEHEDCIRLAYEWLDAQNTTLTPSNKFRPLKHIIEKWAGRYVSQADVEVAAYLHPSIVGKYPYFNLSTRFVRPSDARLDGIGEALSQDYRERLEPKTYASQEAS